MKCLKMFKNIISKKGDLSIRVVIIAILALLVLGVLIAILITNSRIFSTSSISCEEKGGHCQQSPCPTGEFIVPGAKCKNYVDKDVCCVPFNSLNSKTS